MKTKVIKNINPEAFAKPYTLAVKEIQKQLENVKLGNYVTFKKLFDSIDVVKNEHNHFREKDAINFICNNLEAAKAAYTYANDDLGIKINPLDEPARFADTMIDMWASKIIDTITEAYADGDYNQPIDFKTAGLIAEYLDFENIPDYSNMKPQSIEVKDQSFEEKTEDIIKIFTMNIDKYEDGTSLNEVYFGSFIFDDFSHNTEKEAMRFMFENSGNFSQVFELCMTDGFNPMEYINVIENEALTSEAFDAICDTLYLSGVETSCVIKTEDGKDIEGFAINDDVKEVLNDIYGPSLEERMTMAESRYSNNSIGMDLKNRDNLDR